MSAAVKQLMVNGGFLIPLTQGRFAQVDEEDYARASQFKWVSLTRASKFSTRVYAIRSGDIAVGPRLMHRFIMEPPKGMEVDHRSGDGLDNRRGNLRVCASSHNAAARRRRPDAALPYRGIAKNGPKYAVNISAGRFDTPEEAAREYDRIAFWLWGEFASLNFPEDER